MSTRIPMPDVEVTKRVLQFFWLVDYSGSMAGPKIAMLNMAIREALPEVRKAVQQNPQVQIQMRAIKFANAASWHVGPVPVPLEQFVWPELSPGGMTATAHAISLLTSELTLEKMPRRGYPPVCILLSDGFCTEKEGEYEKAISQLMAQPWGKRAVRLAIAIGDESGYDEEALLKFVSHHDIGLLKAETPEQLHQYIRWAAVTASVGASMGKSDNSRGLNNTTNVVLSQAPTPAPSSNPELNEPF